MSILYTMGNVNLETVEQVAKSIRDLNLEQLINHVNVFNSLASGKLQNEQSVIYRKYFGDIPVTDIPLNDDGTISPSILFESFNNEDKKIVDLSNGQKSTTSILYMAASLCQLDNIYFLMRKQNANDTIDSEQKYEYIKMDRIDCTGELAKISFFDLVYYNNELAELFTEKEKNERGTLQTIYEGVASGIREYFSGDDYCGIISKVVRGNESIIQAFSSFLEKDPTCNEFCKENDIKIGPQKNIIRSLLRFADTYIMKEKNDPEILNLTTLPRLLDTIKGYRNIASHYSKNHVNLTEDHARIVINLSIEVLKCVHKNSDLWKILKEGSH